MTLAYRTVVQVDERAKQVSEPVLFKQCVRGEGEGEGEHYLNQLGRPYDTVPASGGLAPSL